MARKIFYSLLSLILAGLIVFTGCFFGVPEFNTWVKDVFKSDASKTDSNGEDKSNDEKESANSDMLLSGVKSSGLKMNYRLLSASEYEAYGIEAESVLNSYEASVTLANHDKATYKDIDLTAEFVSGPEWDNWIEYTDEPATNFVTFSKDRVQSGETFTISCVKAFSAPITITATAYKNPYTEEVPQSCSIQADYFKSFIGLNMKFGIDWSHEDGEEITGNISGQHDELTLRINNGRIENSKYILYNNSFDVAILVDADYSGSQGTITETFLDGFKLSYQLVKYGQSYNPDGSFLGSYSSVAESLNMSSKYELIYWFDEWEHEFDSEVQRLAGGDYNTLMTKYRANEPIVTLYIRISPEQVSSGTEYVFATHLIVDPTNLYVPAQSPSFDPSISGGIMF